MSENDLRLPVDPKAFLPYRQNPTPEWSSDSKALSRSILRYTGKTLSLRGVARSSGLGYQAVSDALAGRSRPFLLTGLKLARALGMSPWVLADALKQARENHLRERRALKAAGLLKPRSPLTAHLWRGPQRVP